MLMRRILGSLACGLAVLLASSCGGGGGGDITNPPEIASITIAPAGADLTIGSATPFTATALDEAGNSLTGRSFTWSSSDATVASVPGAAGNPVDVTAVAAGTATITATSEGKSGSVLVEVVPDAQTAVLNGRVIDAVTGQGIANATVGFYDNYDVLNPGLIGTQTTGSDGSYTSPALDRAGFGVHLRAEAAGYVRGGTYVGAISFGSTTSAPPLPLVPESSLNGGISGTVRNAINNEPIPSATVELSSPTGQLSGTRLVQADASGNFSFTELSAGTYNLGSYADGFQRADRIGVAIGNNDISTGQDLVLAPSAAAGTIRIVLTWGAEPADLDAHLTGPSSDGGRFHVYYSSRGSLTGPPFAVLDVDDISSFGPETITIQQQSGGIYRYSVHDYTNRSTASSTALGASGATVTVYGLGLFPSTFYVPNQPGNLWTVFEIGGGATPTDIVLRNEMGIAEDPAGISIKAPDAGLIARAVRAAGKASGR
jgi:hypothetical protein